eukprot:scaffold26575_cov101-Isochrysis_galbana.AAC.1
MRRRRGPQTEESALAPRCPYPGTPRSAATRERRLARRIAIAGRPVRRWPDRARRATQTRGRSRRATAATDRMASTPSSSERKAKHRCSYLKLLRLPNL